MKFNIDDYKGKYAMHCKTKEEAEDFCRYLDSIGCKWKNGNRYLNCTYWQSLKSETTYGFNEATYNCISYYKDHGYTILEWSDFMNNTLPKNGIIQKFFKIMGIKPYECFNLRGDSSLYYIDYGLNLHRRTLNDEYKLNKQRSNDIIVDILREKKTIVFIHAKEDQIAIDYALACGYSWIAKNKDGTIYAYKEKPQKSDNTCLWGYDNSYRDGELKIGLPISFLSWDDEEPYYIGY